MRSRSFDKVASIKVANDAGKTFKASAIVHQDPQFLSPNRISLLGTHDQSVGTFSFARDGNVDWQFHERPDWKVYDDPSYKFVQRGRGILRSTGMTQGVMIADDSIQPFAEIEILEAVDDFRLEGLKGHSAEFWFLQRPRDGWYVHRRSWGGSERTRIGGRWTKVEQLGLRFRLLRISHYRDDDRISQERERIDLPGVEIQPIGPIDEEAFESAAQHLWFSFRVLLSFRYRQPINTLFEMLEVDGSRKTKWHSVRLEPRSRRSPNEGYDPPFRGKIEPYLAKGAARIATMRPQQELLHAAAFGYASSYSAPVIESRHTACIEGIERLIEAYEQAAGLARERIDKKRWRSLGKAVRREARNIDATTEEHKAIERMLTDVPRFHLIERMERLAKSLPPNARKGPLELLENAGKMIKARNDIVHGRMVSDYNDLLIEQLRSQTLFEWLWLGFLGCGRLQDSNWALHAIRLHENKKANVS